MESFNEMFFLSQVDSLVFFSGLKTVTLKFKVIVEPASKMLHLIYDISLICDFSVC